MNVLYIMIFPKVISRMYTKNMFDIIGKSDMFHNHNKCDTNSARSIYLMIS